MVRNREHSSPAGCWCLGSRRESQLSFFYRITLLTSADAVLDDVLHELVVVRVVDVDVDHAHALVAQGLPHDGLEVGRAAHAQALGPERLGVLDKVDAAQVDAGAAAVLVDLLELDHVVLAVVPDEVRDVAALPHRRRQLLAAEQEAAVAADADDLLRARRPLRERRADGPRQRHAERLLHVGHEERLGAVGEVEAREPDVHAADVRRDRRRRRQQALHQLDEVERVDGTVAPAPAPAPAVAVVAFCGPTEGLRALLPGVELGKDGPGHLGLLRPRDRREDVAEGLDVGGDGPDELELGVVEGAVVGGHPVEVEDLEARALVPGVGVVLGLVVAGDDDEVGLGEQPVAGLVAEEADAAVKEVGELAADGAGGLEGLDDGDRVLPEEAVDGLDGLGRGGPRAEEQHGELGVLDHGGGAAQGGRGRGAVLGGREGGGGQGRDGRLGAEGHDVDGQADGGGALRVGGGGAEGVEHDLGDLVRVDGAGGLLGDGPEQLHAAQALVRLLGGLDALDVADDGDDGGALVVGRHEARGEVARAGARRGYAHAGTPRDAAKGAGDEGGVLLMAADDELDLGPVDEAVEDGVDLGARHAKDVCDACVDEGVDDDVYRFRHGVGESIE
ncbi:hypothetical protein CTA1_9682 [Colletotrichum tanaceti]|uniref:Uncharacterized protein n=1 Tax=Colletotrichum tanaceti TaxID=1306861 RepID=A0A4U6X5X1_9PEZI|nr:hypothetical protein CTA1_9682 [Colletotrichum tanaceti]